MRKDLLNLQMGKRAAGSSPASASAAGAEEEDNEKETMKKKRKKSKKSSTNSCTSSRSRSYGPVMPVPGIDKGAGKGGDGSTSSSSDKKKNKKKDKKKKNKNKKDALADKKAAAKRTEASRSFREHRRRATAVPQRQWALRRTSRSRDSGLHPPHGPVQRCGGPQPAPSECYTLQEIIELRIKVRRLVEQLSSAESKVAVTDDGRKASQRAFASVEASAPAVVAKFWPDKRE